jgi:hypothetical protein
MTRRQTRTAGLLHIERMEAVRGNLAAKRKAGGGEHFADDHLFRKLSTVLFTAYETSGLSPRECAMEFYGAFAHLLNGKPVETLPAPSLEPEVHAELKALAATSND